MEDVKVFKNWLITGDCHGHVEDRLRNIKQNYPELAPAETAIIILGDAGFNYYLNKKDWKRKHQISKYGYTIYCVRGNHEERPEYIKNMILKNDLNVGNTVYLEDEFPLIRYFVDGENYNIDGHSVLVIGGAYSVDKWYRLQNGWSWFPHEQLNESEMKKIEQNVATKHFDFVFTHTAPIDWEPTDLFLNFIDQSKVDKTMEIWFNNLKEKFDWTVWCFGHYHADRLERPFVEQFYQEYEKLEDVWKRWQKYRFAKELDWWLPKSPNFYMGVE